MRNSEFDPNWRRISNALSALIRRANGEDFSFVIFRERRTEKFVQFAYFTGEGLHLDLPCQTLDDAEMERAIAYFRKHGLEGPIHQEAVQLHLDTGEERPSHLITFNMELGQNVREATDIVLEIFSLVYLFPSRFHLLIEEQ